ncbi:helix-turn-helix domain-containing protein [Caldimonas tepidiphila]|uniref:AraC-like ligand-binding domain-containing protein n=1 Tax=Caldimonas tepidiphila TaxID=2315841 RepID=UPI001F0CB646|nr:helix-turn-helix domain-containing protein [Caldimonas tepidiphila]
MSLFSTDGLAPNDRLRQWGGAVWQLIGGLDSDAFGDDNFQGRIESGEAGALRLCRLQASRHRVVRTPPQIRRSDRSFFKIVAQLQGRASFEQEGRQVWLSPGEWSLYDTTRAYTVINPEPVEQLVIVVPKEQMPRGHLPLQDLMVQRFSGSSGVSRLAWETMLSTHHEMPGMPSATADGVADVIVQLVHMTLLERAGRGTALTQREALRDRFKSYVARHLHDPSLNVEQIAQALGCSRRHLYNALAEESDGVVGYIMAQRLAACRKELLSGDASERTITEIALTFGFANVAHFSRVFKEKYGCTPSECRSGEVT